MFDQGRVSCVLIDLDRVIKNMAGVCYKLTLLSRYQLNRKYDCPEIQHFMRMTILSSRHLVTKLNLVKLINLPSLQYCIASPKYLINVLSLGGRGYSTNFYTGKFYSEVPPLYNLWNFIGIYTILAEMVSFQQSLLLLEYPWGCCRAFSQW